MSEEEISVNITEKSLPKITGKLDILLRFAQLEVESEGGTIEARIKRGEFGNFPDLEDKVMGPADTGLAHIAFRYWNKNEASNEKRGLGAARPFPFLHVQGSIAPGIYLQRDSDGELYVYGPGLGREKHRPIEPNTSFAREKKTFKEYLATLEDADPVKLEEIVMKAEELKEMLLTGEVKLRKDSYVVRVEKMLDRVEKMVDVIEGRVQTLAKDREALGTIQEGLTAFREKVDKATKARTPLPTVPKRKRRLSDDDDSSAERYESHVRDSCDNM